MQTRLLLALSGLLSPVTFAADAPAAAEAPAAAATSGTCAQWLDHDLGKLHSEETLDLCALTANHPVLLVNTASFCGFTRQYQGLEALNAKYRAKGLVVLGFPSNDFSQETGSNKDVADFCDNTFGVKFPMFVKSSVRGREANPLFQALASQSGTTPKWNFYKYLVGRDGKVVAAYSSLTEPNDRELLAALEKALAAQETVR